MSKFYIEPVPTKNAVTKMQRIEIVLGQYQEDVNRCASHIYLYINTYEINAALKSVSKEIDLEKAQLRKLASSLETIVQLYESAEKQAAGQDSGTKTTEAKPNNETETEGAIEKTLEVLEDIVGHDLIAFISPFVELIPKMGKFGLGADIAAGILDALNYMIDDLKDGATLNGLVADFLMAAMATATTVAAGEGAAFLITTVITDACAAATGGIGAAIAPFAAIIGKVGGAGVSVITGHVIDWFNDADWDRDGESNRDEIRDGLEFILDWKYPHGNDHTFYLPKGFTPEAAY